MIRPDGFQNLHYISQTTKPEMATGKHSELSRDVTFSCAVITASDSRTLATDRSGKTIVAYLESCDYPVRMHKVVPDDIPQMRTALAEALESGVEVVLFNGGTGISRRDSTIEAIEPLFEKTVPGFGELFRMLSFEEIGPASMLSRAVAGVYRNALIFCMPGSTGAVQLAMERLIVPDLRHFVWEILRQST